MADRQEQVAKLGRLLGHIDVPAKGGMPAIEMVFIGPATRIAEWLYDQGVRVHDNAGE